MNDLAIREENGVIPTPEAGLTAAAAREQYEIQAAMIMAKKFPRDELKANLKLMDVVSRAEAAEAACYSFKRGGAQVKGPSVRLARQAARCWGNLRSGFTVVSVDQDFVHIKGYCLDLETNTRREEESKFKKRVQRKVWANNVSVTEWVVPDERDLRELVNKNGAICERNAVLGIIPSDMVSDAIKKANATLISAAAGELKLNKTDTLKALLSLFSSIDVNQEMLEKYLGHSLDTVGAEELADLKQILMSIRDGNTKRDEHFDMPKNKASAAVESLAEDLKSVKVKETKSAEVQP